MVSDKVDMDTLKEISDSATKAKTTATLLEDTATKLKDNKTLIAGTSGAKTVTLSSGTATAAVFDEILTEVKKTSGSLSGAVVDSVTGLTESGKDLTGATSVTVRVTKALRDLTGVTFDSEVTKIDLADTAATKFSLAQLEGHALNYIGDSGSAGYHLIEDSYADIEIGRAHV